MTEPGTERPATERPDAAMSDDRKPTSAAGSVPPGAAPTGAVVRDVRLVSEGPRGMLFKDMNLRELGRRMGQ